MLQIQDAAIATLLCYQSNCTATLARTDAKISDTAGRGQIRCARQTETSTLARYSRTMSKEHTIQRQFWKRLEDLCNASHAWALDMMSDKTLRGSTKLSWEEAIWSRNLQRVVTLIHLMITSKKSLWYVWSIHASRHAIDWFLYQRMLISILIFYPSDKCFTAFRLLTRSFFLLQGEEGVRDPSKGLRACQKLWRRSRRRYITAKLYRSQLQENQVTFFHDLRLRQLAHEEPNGGVYHSRVLYVVMTHLSRIHSCWPTIAQPQELPLIILEPLSAPADAVHDVMNQIDNSLWPEQIACRMYDNDVWQSSSSGHCLLPVSQRRYPSPAFLVESFILLSEVQCRGHHVMSKPVLIVLINMWTL